MRWTCGIADFWLSASFMSPCLNGHGVCVWKVLYVYLVEFLFEFKGENLCVNSAIILRSTCAISDFCHVYLVYPLLKTF